MRLKIEKKHSKKKFIILYFTMFFLGIYLSFNYLDKNIKKKVDDVYNEFLLDREYSNNDIINSFSNFINSNETKYLNNKENKDVPVIYIYNTHESEEYAANELFSFSPNVTMVNYILESNFNTNNYKTLVEERSISELLDKNSWNYAGSYMASRIYLEDVKLHNPSLKYFIDVHRDSLPRNRTTVTINDKEYASLLFIVGLENENFQANLDFTNRINDKLNEYYPNLSKGILKKSGIGVNGVYNQDFSPYTILVEVGGYENTTYEVLNSSLAFAKCFLEVINEGES